MCDHGEKLLIDYHPQAQNVRGEGEASWDKGLGKLPRGTLQTRA